MGQSEIRFDSFSSTLSRSPPMGINEEFLDLVRRGLVEDARKFVRDNPGVDVNFPSAGFLTPLRVACDNDDAPMIDFLFSFPSLNPNVTGALREPVVEACLRRGNARALQSLLHHRVSVNFSDENYARSIENGHLGVLEVFVAHDSDISRFQAKYRHFIWSRRHFNVVDLFARLSSDPVRTQKEIQEELTRRPPAPKREEPHSSKKVELSADSSHKRPRFNEPTPLTPMTSPSMPDWKRVLSSLAGQFSEAEMAFLRAELADGNMKVDKLLRLAMTDPDFIGVLKDLAGARERSSSVAQINLSHLVPKRPAFENELEYLQEVWAFLADNIGGSLLSLNPTAESTPGVWVLNRHSPSFEQDQEFVLKYFPSHHVMDVSGHQSMAGDRASAEQGGVLSNHRHQIGSGQPVNSSRGRCTTGPFITIDGRAHGITSAHLVTDEPGTTPPRGSSTTLGPVTHFHRSPPESFETDFLVFRVEPRRYVSGVEHAFASHREISAIGRVALRRKASGGDPITLWVAKDGLTTDEATVVIEDLAVTSYWMEIGDPGSSHIRKFVNFVLLKTRSGFGVSGDCGTGYFHDKSLVGLHNSKTRKSDEKGFHEVSIAPSFSIVGRLGLGDDERAFLKTSEDENDAKTGPITVENLEAMHF
jgi:hypothetical protein